LLRRVNALDARTLQRSLARVRVLAARLAQRAGG
jgi:hypothetical protein